MGRHVVYDYTFEEQAKLLVRNVERLDDVIRGAEWRIANHSETCEEIPGTILRITFTDPFPGIPAMKILFSITDANSCTVHWIEFVDASDGDLEYEDDIPF